MGKEKVYGVWAVRSGASIFGRAEGWCKEDGKPLEFDTEKMAQDYAAEMNRQAAGEAGTKCCPHERGHYGHCTGWKRTSGIRGRTSYSFCTYRSSFQGGCGLFLFDTFLFYSQTYYKRIHDFHYGRACHCAGALFLRLNAPTLQRACAAAPVLKLFKQISRLEGI